MFCGKVWRVPKTYCSNSNFKTATEIAKFGSFISFSVERYVSFWADLTFSVMGPEEVPQREKLSNLGSPQAFLWHAANPLLQLGSNGVMVSCTLSPGGQLLLSLILI